MADLNRTLAGRYELRETIGRGGMAEVRIGQDLRLNRTIAVKMLREDLARDSIFQTRFRREAQSAANLNHPAIVAVYDTGEEPIMGADGIETLVPYIVMEYVEGHTVRELLTDGDPVPIDEAVDIVSGVLGALEYSHHQGLVHRDIKPGNVMLTTDGKVKVMDFGIARALTDSAATMTQTDAVVGTAQYLSPEQARGEQVDARSDLYSTGCLLFELLTGRPPFRGDSAVAVAFQHVSQLPPVPSSITPDIPEALDRVVMKSLAKSREERYSDAAHMRSDLVKAMQGKAISAPATNSWTDPKDGATTVLPPAHQPAGNVYAGGAARPGGATAVFPSVSQFPPADSRTAAHTQVMPGTQGLYQESKGRKVWPWALLILVIIGVLTGITWHMLTKETTPPVVTESTTVPEMKGMDTTDARKALTDAGLVPVITEPVNSDVIEDGLFVSSDPAPGTTADKGAKIKITFSSGPGEAIVPNLKGMDLDQARTALDNAKLTLGSVRTEDSGAQPKDKIISSDPAVDSPVKAGSKVDVVIASGSIRVPTELAGKTKSEVLKWIADNNLHASTTTREVSNWPPDTVLEVTPTGLVEPGTTLTVTLAVAPVAPPPPPDNTSPISPSEVTPPQPSL
ncbi:MAG: Stk1 family PASTA domain-containing Ser/Thr kinase [Actinomycetaceae bacterium]|nr:Stk1 family PASTA domain-containing Ser/Thr kinase [Actinomycetaceae bacterium]